MRSREESQDGSRWKSIANTCRIPAGQIGSDANFRVTENPTTTARALS
jgi:hypothetical protein